MQKIKKVRKHKNVKNSYLDKYEKDDKDITPSPAEYNIKDLSNKAPSWRIGLAKRKLIEVRSKTPGSGKYEYKTYIGEGPKYSFKLDGATKDGKRNAKLTKKTIVPGPGHYNPLDSTHSSSFTIGIKRSSSIEEFTKNNKSPGVGTYNLIKTNTIDTPSYSIPREIREYLDINNSPAPNKYNYNVEGSSSKGPQWSFGKTERFGRSIVRKALLKNNFLPGPGSYDTQYFIGNSGPVYSFPKVKYSHADVEDISMEKKEINFPSPATYNNARYIPDTPIFTISQRFDSNEEYISARLPGPGFYNPNKDLLSEMKRFPVWSINMSEKDESKRITPKRKKGKITPGPGHYYSKKGLIPEGPKYTMRKRLKRSKSNGIPGPGKYKINANNHPEEPKYSFGKEKKCNYILKQAIKDGFPGPGKYNVNVKNFTKGYAFSKNKKIRKVENITPGPGYYKIPTAFDYISEHTRQHGIFDKTFQYV